MTRAGACGCTHTGNMFVPSCCIAWELFEICLEPVDDATAMKTVAELHWWFVQALPFARGSTAIAEWLVAYIFRSRGSSNIKFEQDPAALAYVTPNTTAYLKPFAANIEFAEKTTAPVVPASRLLAHAARTGRYWATRRLLREASAMFAEPTGCTALHLAARDGHKRIVKQLLRAGAKVEATLPGWGRNAAAFGGAARTCAHCRPSARAACGSQSRRRISQHAFAHGNPRGANCGGTHAALGQRPTRLP